MARPQGQLPLYLPCRVGESLSWWVAVCGWGFCGRAFWVGFVVGQPAGWCRGGYSASIPVAPSCAVRSIAPECLPVVQPFSLNATLQKINSVRMSGFSL